MTHKTPDGCTIILPDMNIHAFVSASRADFVRELLAKNPTLPATQLTKRNLLCCVLGKIARLGQAGPFSAQIKAQVQGIQRHWLSSTVGDVLHELFDGKLPKAGPLLPTSVLSTTSASFCKTSKLPPPIVSNKGTNPIAMDTKRPATAPSALKCVDSNQSFMQVKPQSKPFHSKAMLPYNANVVVQMAQFLEQGYRKKLIQNGNCLLVSLSAETGHTLATNITHAHLLDRTDQAASLRRIRLITTGYASIVLEFENKAHKNLAARQIEGLKFQFEDNDPIKLDVQEFSDNPASANATYTLGSGPLHFCDHQESLQRFFCKEGFVPIEDVITTRRTGTLKTEVLIRYRFSPGFLEKFSALPGGHRDNRIPAEPAESCSLCPSITRQDRLQSIPNGAHQPDVRPSPLTGDNGGTNAAARPLLKIPGPGLAAAYPSLDDLKITTYIAVFTSLNGVEATTKVSPRLFARGLNKFLDAFYPDSDFEGRLAVLHRIDGGERADDWELLCKELRRHFAIEYMSDGEALSSKRKSLADDYEAARKRPKRAVAADYI